MCSPYLRAAGRIGLGNAVSEVRGRSQVGKLQVPCRILRGVEACPKKQRCKTWPPSPTGLRSLAGSQVDTSLSSTAAPCTPFRERRAPRVASSTPYPPFSSYPWVPSFDTPHLINPDSQPLSYTRRLPNPLGCPQRRPSWQSPLPEVVCERHTRPQPRPGRQTSRLSLIIQKTVTQMSSGSSQTETILQRKSGDTRVSAGDLFLELNIAFLQSIFLDRKSSSRTQSSRFDNGRALHASWIEGFTTDPTAL